LQSEIAEETKNPFTLNKGGGVMFLKSPVFKLALLLVAILLVTSIAFGTPVLADGGAGQPYPPTQSPPQGAASGDFLVVTLLTILQLIL
jgi:hypothetical protein